MKGPSPGALMIDHLPEKALIRISNARSLSKKILSARWSYIAIAGGPFPATRQPLHRAIRKLCILSQVLIWSPFGVRREEARRR